MSAPALRLIAASARFHSAQSRGGSAKPACASRSLAIEQQARVDVPRHAVEAAVEHVGIPDAGEVVVLAHHGRCVHVRLQRLQRTERGQLRHPGVAELGQVRQRIAGERGQQLLVRRGERQRLHLDADAGIVALEVGQQRRHHLGLASHRPEFQHGDVGVRARAGHQGKQCEENGGVESPGVERPPQDLGEVVPAKAGIHRKRRPGLRLGSRYAPALRAGLVARPLRRQPRERRTCARGRFAPHFAFFAAGAFALPPSSSQPPVKPARSRPLRMYGFFFITFQTKSSR